LFFFAIRLRFTLVFFALVFFTLVFFALRLLAMRLAFPNGETAPVNSLSGRPKPSHRSSTANRLSLRLSLRLRLRQALSTSCHRNHRSPRSHHHSRTHLRT
jgi:hypothetical protein